MLSKNWHTKQGLVGGDSVKSEPKITSIRSSQQNLIAGDSSGQVILFKLNSEEQLEFKCEVTGFDFDFDSAKSYEISQNVTQLEIITESKFLAANEKEIKLFSINQQTQKDSCSAAETFMKTG